MTSSSQYITVRETAQILGVTEKKVMDMIEDRQLQAYRIADQFLRLKRTEVMELRNSGDVDDESVVYEYGRQERVHDFFYYNDFYIISTVIILALLYIIFFVS